MSAVTDAASLIIGAPMAVAGSSGLLYIAAAIIAKPAARKPRKSTTASNYPGVDRVLVPMILPLAVGLGIAAAIFFVAQILLVLSEPAATAAALLIALAILAAGTVLATVRHVSRLVAYGAIGVPVLALVIAGSLAYAQRQNGNSKSSAAAPAIASTAAPAASVSLEETTTDNKFSSTALTAPAGQMVTLSLQNNGKALHNWHVIDTKDDSGKDITMAIVASGASGKVSFTISKPGTYKFQCDVHPTEMTGTLTVTQAAGSAATPPPTTAAVQPGTATPRSATATPRPSPTASASVVAQPAPAPVAITETTTDNKFSSTNLTVKAGQQVTLTVQNQGKALHNWHVIDTTDDAGKDITMAIVASGASGKVSFTISKPGTYKFQCDVHPAQMTGTLVVQ